MASTAPSVALATSVGFSCALLLSELTGRD
jgi:hypothetical protein